MPANRPLALTVGDAVAIDDTEYGRLVGTVKAIDPDAVVIDTRLGSNIGDITIARRDIRPHSVTVRQCIQDDFSKAFLSGVSLLEYRLARRCAALSRQLASKPAIKAAKALRQIPHTSFRSTASESGKSPKPLDYSRNPR